MATSQAVTIANLTCGSGRPLLWIAGPCVIESHELTLSIAHTLKDLAERLRIPLVFKASFDKANRRDLSGCSSGRSLRYFADSGFSGPTDRPYPGGRADRQAG